MLRAALIALIDGGATVVLQFGIALGVWVLIAASTGAGVQVEVILNLFLQFSGIPVAAWIVVLVVVALVRRREPGIGWLVLSALGALVLTVGYWVVIALQSSGASDTTAAMAWLYPMMAAAFMLALPLAAAIVGVIARAVLRRPVVAAG